MEPPHHRFLETGRGEVFEAAHVLYLRNGFEWCGAFGDYEANDFSVFMKLSLAAAVVPKKSRR